MNSQRVCVIGAGLSGLAAAKVLKQHAIQFDCFEKGSNIGGIWRFDNDNGMSSIYASLHTNTSKQRTCFKDFPMPEDYPSHPHHTQVLKYLEDYTDHFGLYKHITFNTEVTEVLPLTNGGWEVTLNHAKKVCYQAVVVANGHYWYPNLIKFPGYFSGKQIHSHDYKTPNEFKNLNVLVVGIGSSGADIACEISKVARQTCLSTRSSTYILPKYILGRPIDHLGSRLSSRLPLWFQRLTLSSLLEFARGSQTIYGVAKPNYPLLAAPVTLSNELLELVKQGRVKIRPNVEELTDKSIIFSDGSKELIDVIIYATGYQLSFPFFKSSFMQVEGNDLPLYRQVVHPDYPNLFFIGLIDTFGGLPPLAETQSHWVAGLLAGKFKLPKRDKMWRVVEEQYQQLRRRYVLSAQYTRRVDFYSYINILQTDIS